MEHSDFAPAVSFSLSASSAHATRSPHRLAWLTALAFGAVGSILALWGTPTPAPSTAIEPGAAASVSDAVAFASGCERGDASACNDLGVTALHSVPSDVPSDVRSNVPSDPGLAVRSFERACQSGSPDGCSNLGALYESGVGVHANLTNAAGLYEQACAGGAALGCSNLGALYARGKGVARDASEAQRLFSMACNTGSAAGCNNLMHMAR